MTRSTEIRISDISNISQTLPRILIVCIRNIIKTIEFLSEIGQNVSKYHRIFEVCIQNVFQNRKRATISPHPFLFPNQTYRIIPKKKKRKKEEREKKNTFSRFEFPISTYYRSRIFITKQEDSWRAVRN